jgi:hypothetical protein
MLRQLAGCLDVVTLDRDRIAEVVDRHVCRSTDAMLMLLHETGRAANQG